MTKQEINKAIGDFVGKQADYFSCLNAMHEAEKCLKREQIRDYEIFLIRLLGLPLESTPYEGPTFPLIHATAAERAEALLRTIGKWMEEPTQ